MIKPFHALNELHRELSRVFDDGPLLRYDRGDANGETSGWVPHVDIREDASGYRVYVDVPGVAPEDVEVTVHNNVLTISGERNETNMSEGEQFKRRERSYGSFLRQFSLPDEIDKNSVNAAANNGVLIITIPRAEDIQPRSITVTGE